MEMINELKKNNSTLRVIIWIKLFFRGTRSYSYFADAIHANLSRGRLCLANLHGTYLCHSCMRNVSMSERALGQNTCVAGTCVPIIGRKCDTGTV